MKYAWYIDDEKNTGMEFIGISNTPMQLNNALSLTCDTSAEKAFSVPAFETDIMAKKVKYNDDYAIDGKHSILDEITFEEWNNKNYMITTKEQSSNWKIPLPIKKLYNKRLIRDVIISKSTVTIKWEYPQEQQKIISQFIFTKKKNFENKAFEKIVTPNTYYIIQDFCKANL